MAHQATVITKKRRGPAPTGKGLLLGVRLQPDQLAALDAAIVDEGDKPSRPEMIRRVLTERLTVGGYLRIDGPGRGDDGA